MNTTHVCSLIDFSDLAAKPRDMISYLSIYAARFDDQGRRQLTQIEQQPWDPAAFKALGLLDDDTSFEAQVRAAVAYTERAASRVTERGKAHYEVQVMTPAGLSRLLTRRFTCEAVGYAEPTDQPLSDVPAAPDDLQIADSKAATPGLFAVLDGTARLTKLMQTTVDASIGMVTGMQDTWRRENDRLRQDNDRLRAELETRERSITDLHNMLRELLEAGGGAVPSAPSVDTETIKELGGDLVGTAREAFLQWMGAPTELAEAFKAAGKLDPAVRARLFAPKILGKLTDPKNAEQIGNLLNLLESA